MNVPAWMKRPNVPGWYTLHRLGKLRLLRSSYFWLVAVPLLAQWLSLVDREVQVRVFGTTLTLIFDLPFSWKVFYFSAVAFAIATSLYSWRCPGIIRHYGFFDDYKKDGSSQHLLKIMMFQHDKMTDNEDELTSFVREFCLSRDRAKTTISRQLLLDNYDIDPGKIADAFHFMRVLTAMWYPQTRKLCSLFYLVGFSLLLWVFLRTFWFVIWYVTVR